MKYWLKSMLGIAAIVVLSVAYYYVVSQPRSSLILPKYITLNPNFTKELTLMSCQDEEVVIEGHKTKENRCAITYQRVRLRIDSIYSFAVLGHHLDHKKNIHYCRIYMTDGNKINVKEECQDILPWD